VYDEATTIWNDLIQRNVDAHGWAHDLTLDACAGYSSMLLRDRRFDDAEALVRRAIAGAGDALAADSDWSIRLDINLASALAGKQQFSEAMPIFRSAVAHFEAKFGADHPLTLMAMNNYALALIESGDSTAATRVLEPLVPRVTAGKFASLEPGIRRNLGHALLNQRRYSEAETQLTDAWRLSVARGERANAAKVAALLADLHQATARPESAKVWRAAAGL
jgi:tetratricopeptide (TPR) repeat protein